MQRTSLKDIFTVPPLSVLNATHGYWQQRKAMWRNLIGDDGDTRKGVMGYGVGFLYPDIYMQSMEEREQLGIPFEEYLNEYVTDEEKAKQERSLFNKNVSLFDPVLAEVLCRWFSREGDSIYDCFAGDTQKGLVFGYCGRKFSGIELRQEQVDVNSRVLASHDVPVSYICDDGRNVRKHFGWLTQDMLFSCPPYYNLEVYSDDERDASNQRSYADYVAIIEKAFGEAITCLKINRFAVIVVSNVRDRNTGEYYDIVSEVKRIFGQGGMRLYNELVYIEPIGVRRLMAERTMRTRKVTKVHQNILVFYKGDTRKIKMLFPNLAEESK